MFKEEVKVLSVVLATNALNGELMYQVNLGRIVDKPVKESAPPSQAKSVAANTIVLYMPIQGKCPYVPGATYSLTIYDDGTLNLSKTGP